MTFLTELARLKAAATKGYSVTGSGQVGVSALDVAEFLVNHADAIEALVKAAELQNRMWHSPAVTKALAALDAASSGEPD